MNTGTPQDTVADRPAADSRFARTTFAGNMVAGIAVAAEVGWAADVVPVDPAVDWFGPGFEEWLTRVVVGEGEDPGFEPPPEWWDSASPDEGALSELYGPRMNALLDEIVEDEAVLAMRAARRARSVDAAREWALVSDEFVLWDAGMSASKRSEWVMRCFLSEVATRQRLSEMMADRLVEESRLLVAELPGTLEALESARISYRHAQVIIEQAKTLPVAARAGFEEAILPEAALLPVAKFRKVAVRAREYLHPDSIAARTKTAIEERYLSFDPAADGMAQVTAYLPADRAQALFNRVTAVAKSLQQMDGETRTLPQLRADVASDLLLDGHVPDPHNPERQLAAPVPDGQVPDGQAPDGQVPGGQVPDGLGSGWRVLGSERSDPGRAGIRVSRRERRSARRKGPNWGIRPTVIVTVPVMTLLGHSDEPGILDGYGPIDADTARRLAAQAPSFRRLLVHPETGVALSLGTEHYRVPADLRLWLHLRDGVCRFPGCNRPAIHSHIDHSRAAVFGGPTDAANLAALCGPHHQLKHATTWQVVNRGDGILDWTSPTGKNYTTYPATTMPHPPPPAPAPPMPAPSPPPRTEPVTASPPPDPLDEAPPF